MQKNLKTIAAYTESTDLIFKAFKQMIYLVTLSLLKKCWGNGRIGTNRVRATKNQLAMTSRIQVYEANKG
jgi:hypothetical protein